MKSFLFLFFILTVEALASKDSLFKKEPTVLEIKDCKEIVQTETNYWDSPGFVALLTVIISGGIGFLTSKYITLKTLKTQIDIGEKQIALAKEQLLQQSKISIEAIRANNISNARINWIEELRPILGKLISDISLVEFEIKSRLKKFPKKELETNEPLYKNLYELNKAFNEVKLFLNHDETDHIVFIELVDKFIENSVSIATGEIDAPNNVTEDALITQARKILKDTWEQAKNEVKR